MAWDEPAPTITSGCYNPSKGRFLHPSANRAITLREAALLQTFPPRYFFPADAGKEAVALMIGNALPPTFTRRHARGIATILRARENECIGIDKIEKYLCADASEQAGATSAFK
jgi:DNA (cytosine-5)-methyltransferase 1